MKAPEAPRGWPLTHPPPVFLPPALYLAPEFGYESILWDYL